MAPAAIVLARSTNFTSLGTVDVGHVECSRKRQKHA
jgi:hypothetical protein